MDKPLVKAVAFFCLGIVLGRMAPWLAVNSAPLFLAVALAATSVLILAHGRAGRAVRIARWSAVLPLTLAAGNLRYALALRVPPEDVSRCPAAAPVRLIGAVADYPRIARHGITFVLDCRHIVRDGRTEKTTGRVEIDLHCPVRGVEKIVARGNLLAVTGRLTQPEERGNPGERSARERLTAEGIRVRASLYDPAAVLLLRPAGPFAPAGFLGKIRRRMETAIRESLPAPGGAPGSLAAALLEGLVLGAKGGIPFAIRENFREIGVIHILVVSGLHVGFIFCLSGLLFSPLPLRWRYGLAVPGIILYVAITGAGSPAARAGLMATALSLSYACNQPRNLWTAIACSALCLLLVNPLTLFQAGFQLSYLIVLSIIALAPGFASRLVFLPPRLRLWLAVPLAAQAGSLPLTVYYFQTVSPLALLANILVIPLAGIIVNLGFLALLAGLLSPPLALLLNYPNRALLALILAMVAVLSRLPGSSFHASFASTPVVLSWYLFLLALSRWQWLAGRRLRAAAALAVILLVAFSGVLLRRPSVDLEAVIFNGDSGDIVFVSLPGGKGILVAPDADPGNEAEEILRPFFIKRGIRRLDLLILTQSNPGRLSLLNGILRFAAVGEIWDHPHGLGALSQAAFLRRVREEGIRYRRLRMGDRREFGGAEVSVLWPSEEKAPAFTTDLSLVFALSFRKTTFLFPSQTGTAGQRGVMLRRSGLRADVLLAPARGSRSRTHEPFLRAVSPRLAVLAQGKKYFGRYPADCGDYLAGLGAEVHRTGEEGCVIVRSDGEKIWTDRVGPPGPTQQTEEPERS